MILLFGIVLVVIAASVVITNSKVSRVNGQQRIAGEVNQTASELGFLSIDYFLNREPQLLKRWQTRFDFFSSQIDLLQVNEAEQQTIVAEMKAGRARMKQIFESTISESDDFHSGNFDQKRFRVASSRIAVQSQNVVGDAYTLLTMLRTQGRNLILTRDLLVYSLIAFFGLCFFTVSVFIFRAFLIR